MSLAEIRVEIAIAAAQLLHAIGITDKSTTALQSRREAILISHDPATVARKAFNTWRQTHEGQAFKAELYARQGKRCRAIDCPEKGKTLSLKSLQFDHIKPLSKYPEFALDKQNLQLLCGPCNLRKGSQEWPKMYCHPTN